MLFIMELNETQFNRVNYIQQQIILHMLYFNVSSSRPFQDHDLSS